MTELTAIRIRRGTLFDAAAKENAMLAGSGTGCFPAQFLRQIDVFHRKQPQTDVTVQGFGTDHFRAVETSFQKSSAEAGIQRLIPVLLNNLVKKFLGALKFQEA